MNEEGKGLIVSVGKGEKRKVVQNLGPKIKVQGQRQAMTEGGGIDLVFVIDTTGSMSDKIHGLIATCNKFVDELAKLNLAHRVAIVAFGDLTVPGDDITVFRFTDSLQQIKATLMNIPRYSGGGNLGESSLEALDKAMALPFRPRVVKAIVLITDEPALQHQLRANDFVNRLHQSEILTFVVSPPENYFQEMARGSGGSWYQVSASTDFTGILDMFRNLAVKLSCIVADVYLLGHGSVSKYLQLKAHNK